ncbi:hypothetical protein ACFWY9_26200 [Amycolatopsis sp. NPDC059027]|uniref:hypothetical protein n=1 Tax=Amycolatopsis sp. NPDC059027 TaxID=3346709 RepID=UPI00366BE0E3
MSDSSPMPGQLKMARSVLYVQSVVNALSVGLMVCTIASRIGHEQLVRPGAYFLIALSVLISVLLLVSTVRLESRPPWLRSTVIFLEIVVVIAQLVVVLIGTVLAVAGLVLAAIVLVVMTRKQVVTWLDPPDDAPE